MCMRKLLLAVVLVVVAAGSTARAEVPKRLNFQGILLDSVEGVVPDGVYNLTFRIFDAATGGTALWEETQMLPTENGLFNTFLGLSAPVPDSVFSGPDRWLEIQLVDNADPYEPRGKIGSVAYAYRVGTVDQASGGAILGTVIIEGGANTITLAPDAPGDDAVQVPDDAISNGEILDEPGLAQGLRAGDVDVTSMLSVSDIVVCTLTIPAPGYIVVEANGQSRFAGTNVNDPNYFDFQIDETAGGLIDINHYQRVGFGASAAVANTWWPISIRRTYYKAAAGTYVFRLEAVNGNNQGTKSIWNPVITATYFPRAYGPIINAAAAGDPDIPASARALDVQGDNVANPGPTRQVFEYDLSEPK